MVAAIFTNTQDVMTPFVVNGVTTVFDLNARAGHFGQRNFEAKDKWSWEKRNEY